MVRVFVGLDEKTLVRVDRLVEIYETVPLMAGVGRQDVLRAAIRHGLAELEQQAPVVDSRVESAGSGAPKERQAGDAVRPNSDPRRILIAEQGGREEEPNSDGGSK